MNTREVVTKHIVYASEVVAVESTEVLDAEVIAWADANPVVWKIVTQSKSHAFGKNSSDYLGCYQKSDSPGAALARAAHFKQMIEGGKFDPPAARDSAARARGDFWAWRARFTLKRYQDKGFKGGFFQQYDGAYDRGCQSLDYTPSTLDEVVDRFIAWCESGACQYSTVAIKLDKKVIRTVKP